MSPTLKALMSRDWAIISMTISRSVTLQSNRFTDKRRVAQPGGLGDHVGGPWRPTGLRESV